MKNNLNLQVNTNEYMTIKFEGGAQVRIPIMNRASWNFDGFRNAIGKEEKIVLGMVEITGTIADVIIPENNT